MFNKISLVLIIIIIILLLYIFARGYYEGLVGYNSPPPVFNWGTREWYPTHMMSYDVRGDIPVQYYPVGLFNQPEYPVIRGYPNLNTNFYTPEYVNPWLGVVPSQFNSNFSVPYKVDYPHKTISKNIVKPILE
jgi:hypothetical protein